MSKKNKHPHFDDEYHLIDEVGNLQINTSQIKLNHNHSDDSNAKIKNSDENLKKLWIVSGICLLFMTIEIIGGYIANSIAIMSDAAHLLSDFLGFLISIVSIYISRKGATHKMSYGYHRAEVIGALVSVCLIWGLTIWLLYEATIRIIHKSEVNGLIMLITAVVGFVFNVVMGLVLAYQGIDHNLHHHHEAEEEGHSHERILVRSKTIAGGQTEKKDKEVHRTKSEIQSTQEREDRDRDQLDVSHHYKMSRKGTDNEDGEHIGQHVDTHTHHNHKNVNVRAALIHVIGDAVQNLGVVIAGIVIYIWPHFTVADPICTIVFSIIVVFTTIRILKDCISVLMEGSPVEFDMEILESDLINIKGVVEIHDLHVWSLSVGKLSLSCHLTSTNPQISLKKARRLIKNKYKIAHSTIQVELDTDKETHDCAHDLHEEIGNGNK